MTNDTAVADNYLGTALVCGSAPCLFKDYEYALKHRPGAKIMAINDAARKIPADYIATLHPEKMRWFKEFSLNKEATGHVTASKFKPSYAEYVDYWHDGCNSGWTSSGSAVKIALDMGFKEIILCGCPLDDSGYGEGLEGFQLNSERRVGHAPLNSPLMRAHRRNLEAEAKQIDASRVFSMSGFTAEIFGKPVWGNNYGND